MIAAVLDTNVLASGFTGQFVDTSTPGELIRRWRASRYELLFSEHIISELAKTVDEPYFARRLSVPERTEALAALWQEARFVTITVEVNGVATHPEDDVVLATAVSGNADYLVTGDLKLQKLGSYEGVRILSPREFLNLLQNDV